MRPREIKRKIMKNATLALVLATSTILLGACKDKKEKGTDNEIIATHYIPKRPQGPVAMPADNQTVNVKWLGSNYQVTVVRTPLDSITVSDTSGQKYNDNRCSVKIKREDGTVFVEKTFYKSSFSSYLQEPFSSGGILANIRFSESDGKNLKFSVIVAMPEATDDLFVSLEMDIDSQGGLAISHDDDMGMLDYDRYEGEE